MSSSTNVYVRIFLPRHHHQPLNYSSSVKLPLIVYFHGGAFILCSADMTVFHDFCLNMAVQLQAVVVSVEYRLAPEHRLPATYDDAMQVLHWIKASQEEEEWLSKYADFSNCFLMGTSAGGNLAYHAGLRATAQVDDLLPLQIGGLILHHAFFSGVNMTDSELRLVEKDPIYHPSVSELSWSLCLPHEADRDHEYCNPTVESGSKLLLDRIKWLGWKVMVTGTDGDPLIDRLIELVKIIKQKGVQVVAHFAEEGFHAMEIADGSKAEVLYDQIKHFIFSSNLFAWSVMVIGNMYICMSLLIWLL
ncbi:hypothetical protein ACOSP7_027338 [Xanthoceras sorbifolium]